MPSVIPSLTAGRLPVAILMGAPALTAAATQHLVLTSQPLGQKTTQPACHAPDLLVCMPLIWKLEGMTSRLG